MNGDDCVAPPTAVNMSAASEGRMRSKLLFDDVISIRRHFLAAEADFAALNCEGRTYIKAVS